METEEIGLGIDDDDGIEQLATYEFVLDDLYEAWTRAVLVYNTFENSGMTDTATVFGEVVTKLSQHLVHCRIMTELRKKVDDQ